MVFTAFFAAETLETQASCTYVLVNAVCCYLSYIMMSIDRLLQCVCLYVCGCVYPANSCHLVYASVHNIIPTVYSLLCWVNSTLSALAWLCPRVYLYEDKEVVTVMFIYRRQSLGKLISSFNINKLGAFM